MTPNTPLHAGTTAQLSVNLDAIVANYQTLARAAGSAICGGVVKADAYGLGVEPVSIALWEAGCREFFVALLSEAAELRDILPEAIIYVLGGLIPDAAPEYERISARPILGSLEEITEWSAYCRFVAKPLPAAVHIDTGINRLGLEYDEGLALLQTPAPFGDFDLCLLMSHLACADEPSHPLNREQIDKCLGLRDHLPGVAFSLANSAGILGTPATHFDLVRPGIALYGGNPLAAPGNALQQVATLEAPVLRLRNVSNGATIGYGGSFTCQRPTKIAILGLGYADGYFRALSGSDEHINATVWLCGQKAPVVGRVSMDMIGIDVTDIPEGQVARGTMVELIGENIRLDDISQAAHSFSYEMLTRLGNRFTRVYSNKKEQSD